MWENEGHIHQRGRCELFGFMHKTLLNPLLRAEYGHFSHFLKTDLQNVVRKNFLEDFSDTLWVENMFRPIRVINRTDSEVIWTRICEDIDHLSKTPSIPKIFPYRLETYPKISPSPTYFWDVCRIIFRSTFWLWKSCRYMCLSDINLYLIY